MRSSSRLLIVLLLLAIALVDAVMFAAVWSTRLASEAQRVTVGIPAGALCLSQVTLVGIWLGLGGSPLPLRLTCSVLLATAWSVVLGVGNPNAEAGEFVVALMLQMSVPAVPLLVMRCFGLCVVEAHVAAEADRLAGGRRRLQFSIRYLLGCMTAVAVVLGTLHYVLPRESVDLRLLRDLSFILFVVGFVAIGLACVWAALGRRRLAMRISTLTFIALATPILLWFSDQLDSDFLPYFAVFHCLYIALLAGMLAVFRIAGYRLHWRRRGHSGGEPTIEHTTHTSVGGDSSRRS